MVKFVIRLLRLGSVQRHETDVQARIAVRDKLKKGVAKGYVIAFSVVRKLQ